MNPTDQELVQIRMKALDHATVNITGGTSWTAILRAARRFEHYYLTGEDKGSE